MEYNDISFDDYNNYFSDSFIEDSMKHVHDIVVEEFDMWDVSEKNRTVQRVRELLSKWCDNLRSQMGEEAHQHLSALGIVDETGMTWSEQDESFRKQIQTYENYMEQYCKVERQEKEKASIQSAPGATEVSIKPRKGKSR